MTVDGEPPFYDPFRHTMAPQHGSVIDVQSQNRRHDFTTLCRVWQQPGNHGGISSDDDRVGRFKPVVLPDDFRLSVCDLRRIDPLNQLTITSNHKSRSRGLQRVVAVVT